MSQFNGYVMNKTNGYAMNKTERKDPIRNTIGFAPCSLRQIRDTAEDFTVGLITVGLIKEPLSMDEIYRNL